MHPQHEVALSSAEAELYAKRRAAGGLQSVQLLAEARMDLKLEVLTDSTDQGKYGTWNGSGSGPRTLCKLVGFD